MRGGGGWKRAYGSASEALPEETGSQQIGGTYGVPRQSSTLQWSNYCILGLEGETLAEGQLPTTREAVAEFFRVSREAT